MRHTSPSDESRSLDERLTTASPTSVKRAEKRVVQRYLFEETCLRTPKEKTIRTYWKYVVYDLYRNIIVKRGFD